MLGENILICGLLAVAISQHCCLAAVLPGYDKSEYLMDSPQHVIKPANYRNSVVAEGVTTMPVPEASAPEKNPVHGTGRMGKSDEMDRQVMYVIIKPAPAKHLIKKYKADNQAIYMQGVLNSSNSGRTKAASGGASDNINESPRTPRLNMAPGAYPVFYSIATANGKFGRNIRALTKEEIDLVERSLREA